MISKPTMGVIPWITWKQHRQEDGSFARRLFLLPGKPISDVTEMLGRLDWDNYHQLVITVIFIVTTIVITIVTTIFTIVIMVITIVITAITLIRGIISGLTIIGISLWGPWSGCSFPWLMVGLVVGQTLENDDFSEDVCPEGWDRWCFKPHLIWGWLRFASVWHAKPGPRSDDHHWVGWILQYLDLLSLNFCLYHYYNDDYILTYANHKPFKIDMIFY